MSRVVICHGTLSVIDTCTDALVKLAVERADCAEMLLDFKRKAPDMVQQCAKKAVARLEQRGVKNKAAAMADYCLTTDDFLPGLQITISAAGKINFKTELREREQHSAQQQAAIDSIKRQFSAALITEFYQAALTMICTEVTADILEHEGKRIVHLQGVKS